MNMRKKLSEANKWLEDLGKKSPRKMESFHNMSEAIKEGVLEKKYKELIAIALAIAQECEWCIAYHVNRALEASATENEILDAAWIAVQMGGGPALMHAGLVLEALDEFEDR